MKKQMFLFSLGMLMLLGVNAQIKFGVQAGATFTDLKISDVSDDMFKSKTGFTAGVVCDIPLIANFAINTGLLYVQRDIKGGENSVTNRFSSLELPANLKFAFPFPVVTPFALAGPYLDCGLSAKSGDTKFEYGDQMNRFSWGMTIGAGVDVVHTVRVLYQYDLGFSSLSRDSWNSGDAKTRGHRISAAILF